MLLSKLRSMDLAIDLGTSRTAVFVKSEGVVFEEPSVVCFRAHKSGRSVIAVGESADQIRGKEPFGVEAIRPLRNGVIDHLEATKTMLQEIARITKINRPFAKPNVLIGAPYHISDIEKRAVRDAANSFRAGAVTIVEEPVAAAIGADIDISESVANMVVDVGSGITEVVVLSLGGIVHSEAIRIGGDAITDCLIAYFRHHHALHVGERTIECLKPILCDVEGQSEEVILVKGTDVITRLPQTRQVLQSQISAAIQSPVNEIVRTIRRAFENTPPMLSGDLVDRGIVLTGGASMLKNFDRLIERVVGVPVRLADNPRGATVRGVGRMLEEARLLKSLALQV